jgi:hypothetical protein
VNDLREFVTSADDLAKSSARLTIAWTESVWIDPDAARDPEML